MKKSELVGMIKEEIQKLNESSKNTQLTKSLKLLDDIFKLAKASKSCSIVRYESSKTNDLDWLGDVIYIKQNTYGEEPHHDKDLNEFCVGIDPDTFDVAILYIPSGLDDILTSISDFKKFVQL